MIGTPSALIAYASARGQSIITAEAPIALVKANDYLNGLPWVGLPVDEDQEDPFPRIINGQEVTLPAKVTTAAYRLAMLAADDVDLEPITEGGAQTIEERVEGAVAVRYAESTIGMLPAFPWLDGLIGKWLEDSAGDGLAINVKVGRG